MKNCRTGLLRIVQTEKAHGRRTDILSGGKSMGTRARPAEGGNTLAEMREFEGFSASNQRYIRRSLDMSMNRSEAVEYRSRDGDEAARIRKKKGRYECLDYIRALMPEERGLEQDERCRWRE